MACCTGQTKCNDTVTIGYLKSFIGSNILTTAGTVVNVSTARTDWRKDAYCPTYAELTGGTLIPNFVDGGTNKWASNVDGITINHGSSYSGNQVVKVEDLILTYTRYKSIAVSASSTSLSECGGSTTLGRTFKLTKTIKAMNDCNGGVPSTSSSEGSDTASTTTYSSTQGWLTINGSTATAPKNGTVSSSTLTTEVKASVNYKGATYTSTGVTVSQAALTGAYETTGTSTATGIDVTYTPTTRTFGCEGGTYTVEAVGKYYTRYKWKDSCGVVYNDVYNDVQGSSNLQTKTGTFAAVQCPIESSTSSSTASYSWSGITSNVTFTQNCSQSCEECEDYIVWGSGNGTATALCEGGSVQVTANVSGIKHIKNYVEGVCQETSTVETSQTQSVTVVIPQNEGQTEKTYTGSKATSQGGTINYTITQPGGCAECTGATTTTEWSGQTVSAAACDTSKNLTLSGTSTTTYGNCPSKIESVTSAVTVNFNENNTSNPTSYTFTFSDATVTVNQAAGPCTEPVVCYCSGVTLSTSLINWSYSSTTQETVELTRKDACIGTVNVASNNAHFTASISGTNIRIQPASTNTGTTDITGVVTVSYTADTTPCTQTINLTQGNSGSCNCASVVFTEKTTTIGSGATSNTVIATASFGTCTGSLGAASVNSEASSWLTAMTSGNDVIIDAAANTDLSNDRSGVVTVTYKANSFDSTYNCSSSFTVTQVSIPCSCSAVTAYYIDPIYTVFPSGGTHGNRILIASGNTHGCGTLSSNTVSNMISGGTLEHVYLDAEHTKVEFYATILPNETGGERSAGIYIKFTPKDPSILTGECNVNAFTLEQKYNEVVDAPCEDVIVNTYYDDTAFDCSSIAYTDYGPTVLSLSSRYPDETVRNYSFRITKDCDWVNFYTYYSNTSVQWMDEFLDSNYPSNRYCTVDYEVYLRERYCTSGSTTISQSSCDPQTVCLDCDNFSFSNTLVNILNDLPIDRRTYNVRTYLNNANHPSCAENANIIVTNSPSWIIDNGDGEIEVYSNQGDVRTSSLTLTVNGCDFTFNVSQNGTPPVCDCRNFNVNVTGNNGAASAHTITVTYEGQDSDACYFKVTGDTSDSWITVNGQETPGSSWVNPTVTINVAANDGNPRTGTVVCYLVDNPLQPSQFCQTTVTIEQASSCDCTYTYSVYDPLYEMDEDGSYNQIIAEYNLLASGDCLSYEASIASASLIDKVEIVRIDENPNSNKVQIIARNTMTSDGCVTGDITFTIYKNGQVCTADTFQLTVIKGCASPYVTYGSLNANSATINGAVANQWYDVGMVTGTTIGYTPEFNCFKIYGYHTHTQHIEDVRVINNGNGTQTIQVMLKNIESTKLTVNIRASKTGPCDSSTSVVHEYGSIEIDVIP